MILHDGTAKRPITDYGIQIPITGSNANRTLEALRQIPEIAANEAEWLQVAELKPLSGEEIRRVHDDEYATRLLSSGEACHREIMTTFELIDADGNYNRYDPTSATLGLEELRDQSLRLAAGTTLGAHVALQVPEQFCFYLGGGMHHGQYDYGEGFCPVNDLVIAVRTLQHEGLIKTAWIVDVDAHKGDGTAALTADDPTITTLSVHMAHGWPLDQPTTLSDGRPNPSHIPSTVDIPIAAGEESHYVPRLKAGMDTLEKNNPLLDLLLVVDGSDPYERDQLPSAELLKMTASQLLERDLYLYQWGKDRHIPMLFVMAGNYGYHSWEVYTNFLTNILSSGTKN